MNYNTKKGVVGIIIISIILCILEGIILIKGNIDFSTTVQDELVFSHESGFYDEVFELELSSEAGTIYYTLDGSEPDTNSIVYEGPILISDASANANINSARTDVSTGFLVDKIEEYSLDQKELGYTVPDYPVDKATVVRAVVYYDAFRHSAIETASYFVGFSEKAGYAGMNILSIVTEPDNLFDYETGIYVNGITFDEYWADRPDAGMTEWYDDSWLWWPANYRNRGKEWEKKVSCQFFDTTGELFLTQDCGIRIHGGITRGQNPKGINLYAREEYDGNNCFTHSFFEESYYASSLTLTPGGNDYIAKLRDNLISDILSAANLEVSYIDYEPYILFLNGEYWGVYWLGERYDEKYLEYHYQVHKNNVIQVKNGDIEVGDAMDLRLYENMVYKGSTLDMTKDENYREICKMIDIDSYIDYFAVMLYASRCGDWPSSNYALWRTKMTESGQAYADGKWRWMVFDMNSSGLTEDLVDFDSIGYAMDNDSMFNNLMKNEVFRNKLLDRIIELGTTVFDSDMANRKIDEHLSLMTDALLADQKRFFGEADINKIYGKADSVKVFFENRDEEMAEMIEKYR